MLITLPTAEILSGKNAQAWVSMLYIQKIYMKIRILGQKKSWDPFKIRVLNSTANSNQFG